MSCSHSKWPVGSRRALRGAVSLLPGHVCLGCCHQWNTVWWSNTTLLYCYPCSLLPSHYLLPSPHLPSTCFHRCKGHRLKTNDLKKKLAKLGNNMQIGYCSLAQFLCKGIFPPPLTAVVCCWENMFARSSCNKQWQGTCHFLKNCKFTSVV